MCGIAGIFQLSSQFNKQDLQSRLQRMSAAIAHRGPDDSGYWIADENLAGFAHRRLSIIDLSPDGAQPMVSPDQRHIIVFNGEIYNFPELKAELACHGERFTTQSDTEVLLAAYRRWGKDCLLRLDGMFAFAIYDRLTRSLFAARDPFGEKPFYYGLFQGCFVFASELKAITSLPGFVPRTSIDTISSFLCLQYLDGATTVFENVSKLKPGHYLQLDLQSQPRVCRYYAFRTAESKDHRNVEDLVDELEFLLTESIRRRLRADVEVGGFLSGGVDSALVMAIAKKKLGAEVSAFTIGFDGWKGSEHLQARQYSQHIGIDHKVKNRF